jgi:hypothetical protein
MAILANPNDFILCFNRMLESQFDLRGGGVRIRFATLDCYLKGKYKYNCEV